MINLVRNGALPPGTRLPPERELIRRLGVSRNSLREAIRILETMGILRVVPGRGTWVCDAVPYESVVPWSNWPPLRVQEAADLLEMRETLEVKAAALAAERCTPSDQGHIITCLHDLEKAIESEDIETIIRADAAFHEAVAGATGNRLLADALRSLSDLVVETRRAVAMLPGRLRRMGSEHKAVADAILRKDPEGAAKAMYNHVRQVAEEFEAAASRERYLSQHGQQ